MDLLYIPYTVVLSKDETSILGGLFLQHVSRYSLMQQNGLRDDAHEWDLQGHIRWRDDRD